MIFHRTMMDNMRRKVKVIHFVGIGGIGMSGIAEVLHNLGYQITGSDANSSGTTERLASLGVRVFYGHQASQVGGADVVVTSTAVRENNPEVVEAHLRNIPVVPRAEMLAELLKMKFSIAISGSHGKTTTTSMIATLLAHGGLDPTMVIGGKLASIGSNARLGSGEIIVAEADESDGSFLRLAPSLAVITNIDLEHVDYYRDLDEIKEAFVNFANKAPFYGATVLCGDDENIRSILPRIKRRFITYGINGQADLMAGDISFQGACSSFSLYRRGDFLGRIKLNAPGMFNVYNALAAIAVSLELDLDFTMIAAGLADFTGVERRLEVKGCVNDVVVVDDYGHHPTEIRATLAAADVIWGGRKFVVFQPHRYSRTTALFHEFAGSFSNADSLIVTDIYAAGEDALPGVHSASLLEAICRQGHPDASYLASFERIVDALIERVRPGDVIITLGAGSVWKVGEEFLRKAGTK
ncbi:MAG: UDP-N-acetylmuramate--L-alanine ligase [Smithellaceae bacterium]|nr:UDP-N-acetylmuramate--L-alanine ligase [Smithellaceae bacterium]